MMLNWLEQIEDHMGRTAYSTYDALGKYIWIDLETYNPSYLVLNKKGKKMYFAVLENAGANDDEIETSHCTWHGWGPVGLAKGPISHSYFGQNDGGELLEPSLKVLIRACQELEKFFLSDMGVAE